MGMNAGRCCLGRGVTTVLDAGSAGYATLPNFRKYIINTATTRIVALVRRLPLMIHIDDPYSPRLDILKPLRKGDVFTHVYKKHTQGVLDTNGQIIPEARERGVIFDPAQGQTHFSFDVAEKCIRQGFLCGTISTDLAVVTAERRVFDLPTMVSKFMAIGVALQKAVARVTANPARVFDYGSQIGTLRPRKRGRHRHF